MKRLLFLLLILSAHCASYMTFAAKDEQSVSTDDAYVKIYINRIQNSLSESCSVRGATFKQNGQNALTLPSKAVKSAHLLIPFISIGSYLKEFTDKIPYIPQEALKIDTPYGQFGLWASESGVMYAQDPHDDKLSSDQWKAKKLVGITRDEHGGKKLFIASLVLKAIKGKLKEDKLKIALEPLR